jgi:hypothetical protein
MESHGLKLLFVFSVSDMPQIKIEIDTEVMLATFWIVQFI